MSTISVREPRPEEAGRIANFMNRHAERLFGEGDLDEVEVRHWFTMPNLWIGVAEQGGELAGYVDVADDRADGTRFEVDARAFDPDVAAALLAAAETRARASMAPGALIRGYAASVDDVAREAYERAGYRVIRHSFQMRIDLDGGALSTMWPDGIVVRTYADTDEQPVLAAVNEAFRDHWDSRPMRLDEWRRWGVENPRFDPGLWFIACDGDEIAGVSLCAWHYSGDPHFGWVSTLAVRRPWRRRGLALALLRHSFAEFARRGATRVGLGVDAENTTGAVRLYERAGMRVARRTDAWEKTL